MLLPWLAVCLITEREWWKGELPPQSSGEGPERRTAAVAAEAFYDSQAAGTLSARIVRRWVGATALDALRVALMLFHC